MTNIHSIQRPISIKLHSIILMVSNRMFNFFSARCTRLRNVQNSSFLQKCAAPLRGNIIETTKHITDTYTHAQVAIPVAVNYNIRLTLSHYSHSADVGNHLATHLRSRSRREEWEIDPFITHYSIYALCIVGYHQVHEHITPT